RERSCKSRPARIRDQGDLRTDRQERGEKVVACTKPCSSPRKRGPSCAFLQSRRWIPACAGMSGSLDWQLLQPPAWIVTLIVAPLIHQLLELVIGAFGQYNAHSRKQVARTTLCFEALPLESECASGICVSGDSQFDCAVERRNAHLAAKCRLVKR